MPNPSRNDPAGAAYLDRPHPRTDRCSGGLSCSLLYPISLTETPTSATGSVEQFFEGGGSDRSWCLIFPLKEILVASHDPVDAMVTAQRDEVVVIGISRLAAIGAGSLTTSAMRRTVAMYS